MALPKGLVAGQRLTWIGSPLPPPDAHVVSAGDRGIFVDYEGDSDHYVVDFNGALFCCAAGDVRPDPRPPAVDKRRHRSA
jgi:hypothetical protein